MGEIVGEQGVKLNAVVDVGSLEFLELAWEET
jgi:hypothetical protein